MGGNGDCDVQPLAPSIPKLSLEQLTATESVRQPPPTTLALSEFPAASSPSAFLPRGPNGFPHFF